METSATQWVPLDDAVRHSLGIAAPVTNTPQNAERLVRTAVFADAPEPYGSLWRNLVALENQLAELMLEQPSNLLVLGGDAFFLQDQPDGIHLMHANAIDGKFFDAQSRLDFDLDWVDADPEHLEDYNRILQASINEVVALNQYGLPQASVEEVVSQTGDSNATSLEHMAEQLQRRGISRFELSGITNALYVGRVIEETVDHIAQDIGRGRIFVHAKQSLSPVPSLGERPTIKFQEGRGFVSGPNGLDADRGR